MSLNLLAQTYESIDPYQYQTQPEVGAGAAIFGGVWLLVWLAVAAVIIAGLWKLFTKAGQAGWASLIPIYNTYILLKIAGRPGWWVLLAFVPLVNVVIAILVGIDVAKRFGYGEAFGALVCGLLGIGYAIIGFGSATYKSSSNSQ